MRYKIGYVIVILSSVSIALSNAAINTPTTTKNSAEKVLNIQRTNYTNWIQNVTYVSSVSYSAKGMQPLYGVANGILKVLVGKTLLPDGYLVVDKNKIDLGDKANNNEWGDLLKTYWAILMIIVFTGLLIVLMPIIGLCFCCCRCAGSCGGRTQPFDKKHDGCRRGFWGLLLIITTSLLIFGVVAAFVTNTYLQNGVENITTSARHGSDDSVKYLNATSSEIKHLLVDNYVELADNLNNILTTTADYVIVKFNNASQTISFVQLNAFVQTLPQIQSDLEKMRQQTNVLRVKASQLNDGLRGVKRELLVQLTKCGAKECRDVLENYQIGKLDVNGIDYNKLPDEMISDVLISVDDLVRSDLMRVISEQDSLLANLRNDLEKEINKNSPSVLKAIKDVGTSIESVTNDLTSAVNRVSQTINNNSNTYLDDADNYIQQYGIYRFYVGLAVSSVLLIVVICLIFGLLCGICGRRPSGYGDDCCNKGAGGSFLMLGVAIIFLTISVLAFICLLHFIVGLVAQRHVCDSIKNPNENELFLNYIDPYVDLNDYLYPENNNIAAKYKRKVARASLEPFRISQMIASCHNNDSIYNVMKLYNFVNLTEITNYVEKYEINKKIEDLIQSINIKNKVDILTPEVKDAIDKLSQSALKEFQSDKFVENLSDNVTNHDLTEIAKKLDETAKNIPNRPDMAEIKASLLTQALHLETYQEKLVIPMTNSAREMIQLAGNLETTLKFNENSFEDAMAKILQEIQFAENFINTEGTEFVQNVAQELLGGFNTEISNYLELIVRTIKNEVGICRPLSNVYNAMIVASCNRVVNPWNGFWLGLSWCIGLFLLTIIFCAKLSTLYQKSDPYPGPIVEAEYLYDAYTERDNIPLANSGPKNRKRGKKYERRRNSREAREYYEEPGSPHGPINGGSSRDTRYNDMAPKHWESGPPRYQSPPIAPPDPEYERPPPYYFPGAPPAQE